MSNKNKKFALIVRICLIVGLFSMNEMCAAAPRVARAAGLVIVPTPDRRALPVAHAPERNTERPTDSNSASVRDTDADRFIRCLFPAEGAAGSVDSNNSSTTNSEARVLR